VTVESIFDPGGDGRADGANAASSLAAFFAGAERETAPKPERDHAPVVDKPHDGHGSAATTAELFLKAGSVGHVEATATPGSGQARPSPEVADAKPSQQSTRDVAPTDL
jgi:hypothetical protein